MARDVSDATPVESRDALVAWFESGSKPAEQFRLGTEHEKFAFFRDTLAPVPYAGERSIHALLEGMRLGSGWEPIRDGEHLIGLADDRGGGAISLEPGGQFELSGAPVHNVHETAAELADHLAQLKAIADPLGIGFLGLGFSPVWSLAEIPAMPKRRYRIMRDYMPKVGTRGLDMMFRTSTVQVNLDFSSEADMVKKLRVSLALQPVASALFANSPFKEGKPGGMLSERSEVWRDTDNQRAGMLPFAFDPGMGFERYVDYALDVPMYFVKRADTYHDVSGCSFRDLLAGKLAALPGERATLSDWVNHVGTIFPEVRLKRYLEMRGADCGSSAFLNALPALFTGLLYDGIALDGGWDLVKSWNTEERQKLRDDVPRLALGAEIGGRNLRDIARDMLGLARAGLARRAQRDTRGRDESHFLNCLDAVVNSGRTRAEDLLALFHGPWKGDARQVFGECAL